MCVCACKCASTHERARGCSKIRASTPACVHACFRAGLRVCLLACLRASASEGSRLMALQPGSRVTELACARACVLESACACVCGGASTRPVILSPTQNGTQSRPLRWAYSGWPGPARHQGTVTRDQAGSAQHPTVGSVAAAWTTRDLRGYHPAIAYQRRTHSQPCRAAFILSAAMD